MNSAIVAGSAFSIDAVAIAATDTVTVRTTLADSQLVISGNQVSVNLAQFKSGEYSATADITLRAINLAAADQLKGALKLQAASLAVSGPQGLASPSPKSLAVRGGRGSTTAGTTGT